MGDELGLETTSNMKKDLCGFSTLVGKGKLSVYLLNMNETFSTATDKLKKCELGHAKDGVTEKVIMLVGATGAGKTTLINGFVNYILGVKWTDKFRFQLIPDEGEVSKRSQAKSQTKWITSYTLHYRQGFGIDYTFTLIDTPGFGDTSGIKRDQEITHQIRTFFTTQGENGIDHIDAIGFVVQASLARLTPTQRYIFDSVLALFGKDISENIFILATFADGNKPPVLAAIKEAQIPHKKVLKFNNSALYPGNEGTDSNPSSSDEDDEDFTEMFWAMGTKSFATFFKLLLDTESKSLILTKDVLEERYRLETYVPGIHLHIRKGLNKLEQLRIEANILKQHEADIERNKNFRYNVTEEVTKRVGISPGTHVTNCLNCNLTCHYPCKIPRDQDKRGCAAMNRIKGICNICPSHCVWSIHANVPYKYEIELVTKTKTVEELKKRYQTASGEKMTKEILIREVINDFKKVQMRVVYYTNEVRKSLDRLKEIALKPSPLTTVEYIDTLIQAEKSSQRTGFQERLHQLSEVRRHAEYLQNMATPGYDPFEEYKDIYNEMLEREGKGVTMMEKLKKLLFNSKIV